MFSWQSLGNKLIHLVRILFTKEASISIANPGLFISLTSSHSANPAKHHRCYRLQVPLLQVSTTSQRSLLTAHYFWHTPDVAIDDTDVR